MTFGKLKKILSQDYIMLAALLFGPMINAIQPRSQGWT